VSTTFAPLKIRAQLRASYAGVSVPTEFGPDGWMFTSEYPKRSFIITAAERDAVEWLHASVAATDETPTYRDLKYLHAAVFGDGYAYQVFAPAAVHVNIHEHALHLFGRLDGQPVLTEFTEAMPGGGRTI
jgi:hypothetical protein